MKMRVCFLCKKRYRLIELDCSHNICFDCLYNKYSDDDNLQFVIPVCCRVDIKFNRLFHYIRDCNIRTEFPDFVDQNLSFRQRLSTIQHKQLPYTNFIEDDMISFQGIRFRSRRNAILFANIGHYRMPHRTEILQHFRRKPLSVIKTLRNELYQIYVVHKNYDTLYSFHDLLYHPLEYEKFIVHYIDSGTTFEYNCYEIENEGILSNMYIMNFIFALAHIWDHRSTDYIENFYEGAIVSRNGTLRDRLQVLNKYGIVHVPENYKNLRYQLYGNMNYSNNEKLFHNLRLVHFRDMAVLEKKYDLRTQYLLLFYKSNFKNINSYDIRREIFSYLEW